MTDPVRTAPNTVGGARIENVNLLYAVKHGVGDLLDPSIVWPKVDFMALEQMITVERTVIATTTDFLSGTQLDQPGVPGVYTIWLASTVGDSTVSITLGGRTITESTVVVLRANSEIREDEDPYFQILSRSNGRPVIAVTEVTSMVCRIRVRFLPAVRT